MDRAEAETVLAALAPDIVARLDAAEKHARRAANAENKADDMRLSAALHVAKARKVCEAAGIGWRSWSQKHLGRQYSEIKRLVRIGAAPDPAAALADERRRSRESMQRSRDRRAQHRLAGPDSPMPWIERSLGRLSDPEAKKLIGLLVSRLPVEDLERMLNGLPTIIERKRNDD